MQKWPMELVEKINRMQFDYRGMHPLACPHRSGPVANSKFQALAWGFDHDDALKRAEVELRDNGRGRAILVAKPEGYLEYPEAFLAHTIQALSSFLDDVVIVYEEQGAKAKAHESVTLDDFNTMLEDVKDCEFIDTAKQVYALLEEFQEHYCEPLHENQGENDFSDFLYCFVIRNEDRLEAFLEPFELDKQVDYFGEAGEACGYKAEFSREALDFANKFYAFHAKFGAAVQKLVTAK